MSVWPEAKGPTQVVSAPGQEGRKIEEKPPAPGTSCHGFGQGGVDGLGKSRRPRGA